MPWAGAAASVPQIIKQDIHSVELVFTAVPLPRADTHPSGAAVAAASHSGAGRALFPSVEPL